MTPTPPAAPPQWEGNKPPPPAPPPQGEGSFTTVPTPLEAADAALTALDLERAARLLAIKLGVAREALHPDQIREYGVKIALARRG